MAVDAAPTKFPSTLPDELTPGDTIVDETAAWMARHTAEGMTSRLGCFLMDPRRNGKAYVTAEIKPNSTGAGVNNIYRFGIRFFRYDLTTRSVDHVSYVKPIVQASVSANQWRGGALATADGDPIWCMYFEGSANLDEGARLSSDLYVARSEDGGQTWIGETLVRSATDSYGGTDYQRPQIAINSDDFGLMLYVDEDIAGQTADYYVRTLDTATNTWGNETNLLSLASGVDASAKTAHSLAVAEDGTALAILWNGLDGSDNQYAHFYFDGSSWSNIGNSTSGGTSGALRRLNSVLVNNATNQMHQKHFISLFCNSTGNTFCQLVDPSSGPQTATTLNSTIFSLNGSDGDSLAGVLDPEENLFIVGQSGTSSAHRTRYGKWTYSTVSAVDDIGAVVAGSTDQLNWHNSSAGDDGWFEDVANTAGTADDTYPQITYHQVLPFIYAQNLHLILMGTRYDGT